MVHAIVVSLIRMVITQRRMLEWETAAAGAARAAGLLASQGPRVFAAEMWAGPAVAVAVLLAMLPASRHALPVALPFLLAWLASPLVAWWLSRPVVPRRLALGAADAELLRRIARRTWHYFERFVTSEHHHLPPDNVQEVHGAEDRRVAGRTSPTNIGMGLLSTLAAHDLGYLDRAGLARRIEDTLASVERLEKHEGHLLNWYDTTSLAPLAPRYVSTVDSGNLAGSLMTLAAGLRERAVAVEDDDARCAGAADTAGVLAEMLATLSRRAHAATSLRPLCDAALAELDALRARLAPDAQDAADARARDRLEHARRNTEPLRAALAGAKAAAPGADAEAIAEWSRLL